MRIDREAFLVAVAALAGCQQDRSQLAKAKPAVVQPPAPAVPTVPTAAVVRPPIPEPVMPPPIVPPPLPLPQPVAVRHTRQTPKQWFRTLTRTQRENVNSSCEDFLARQCRASLRMAMPLPRGEERATEAEMEKEIAAMEPDPVKNLPNDKLAAYCKHDFPPPSCETPLVVAFDNQPVEFAPAAGQRFAFVPGAPMASDWPTATTPWIAVDLDGDGAIASGAELFGSSTVLPGGGRATNGFEALAALDANGDGVLDARDPMFAKLVLWSDRDGDHRSSPDELRPLASVVARISLGFTRDARCNDRGDCEGERGTLHWSDATGADHVGSVIDVYIPGK